jgi:hypothetical protein
MHVDSRRSTLYDLSLEHIRGASGVYPTVPQPPPNPST